MTVLNILSACSVAAVPVIFLLSALVLAIFKGTINASWRISFVATWLTLAVTIIACFSHALMALKYPADLIIYPLKHWLRIDVLSLMMLLLISTVALVIVRFSRNYIHQEPGEASYQSWLMLTLASVSVVITTNHFLIFILAWIMISVSLHELLMFYPNRPRAALAAHKKFLISRIADICIILAIALLYMTHGSLWISDILNQYHAGTPTSQTSHLAAVLFAIAALLKCAQLPLHGWLMQVMEAPTPVSALLHAGIINMGGFLIILLSPLILNAPVAEWLLMLVGGTTAVLASLIMMTRISIKVMLAWSTCAQMGFMLLECGLGLYELALLHLIAHSFYKAYAFLSSGEAVQHYIQDNLVKIQRQKNRSAPSLLQWLFGGAVAMSIVASLFIFTQTFSQQLASFIAIGSVISIAITLMLSENLSTGVKNNPLYLLMMALGIVVLYVLWHALFGQFFSTVNISPLAATWVVFLFVSLFCNYIMLRYYPYSKLSQWLYLHLFAGFYLDEWTTKITMILWPAKLPAKTDAKLNFIK